MVYKNDRTEGNELGSNKMSFGLALIISQLRFGGTEQQLYHLLSGLDRSRFRLLVISLNQATGDS